LITKGETIIANDPSLSGEELIDSFPSEEADPRLVRHMLQCVKGGVSTVVVRTVDTDVLVLLLAFRHLAGNFSSKVFAYFGIGNKSCFYDINEISLHLGEISCRALPFFFAFTGCDTVSSFFNQGKCKMWDRWFEYHDRENITRVFIELSRMPNSINESQLQSLEKFILFVYNPNISPSTSLDEYRMLEFECSTHSNLRLIPPSKVGLLEHAKRACYQGGWIWQHCINNVEPPNPKEWGWQLHNSQFTPRWQIVANPIPEEVVTITCSCKGAKCKHCSCSKKELQCIPFCQRSCIT
jgi:hypothetical protein